MMMTNNLKTATHKEKIRDIYIRIDYYLEHASKPRLHKDK